MRASLESVIAQEELATSFVLEELKMQVANLEIALGKLEMAKAEERELVAPPWPSWAFLSSVSKKI
jgi:hypothetical protein